MAGSLAYCAADDQIVTLGGERDEMEAEGPRGGSGGDAAVGFTLADGLRGGKVSRGDAAISGYSIRRNTGGAELLIENFPAARSFFAIDDADVFLGQVFYGRDLAAGAASPVPAARPRRSPL